MVASAGPADLSTATAARGTWLFGAGGSGGAGTNGGVGGSGGFVYGNGGARDHLRR